MTNGRFFIHSDQFIKTNKVSKIFNPASAGQLGATKWHYNQLPVHPPYHPSTHPPTISPARLEHGCTGRAQVQICMVSIFWSTQCHYQGPKTLSLLSKPFYLVIYFTLHLHSTCALPGVSSPNQGERRSIRRAQVYKESATCIFKN